MLIVVGKISTSGSTLTGADHGIRKGLAWPYRYRSHKDLIAGDSVFYGGALKDQLLAIVTPVSFGIITTKSQLANIAQVGFVGVAKRIIVCALSLQLKETAKSSYQKEQKKQPGAQELDHTDRLRKAKLSL
jgi:hypothetical protein